MSAIGDIKGQMALFDRLVADDDATKVVDLGHESFESFFTLADQIGFVEEARRRGIAPAILFVLTPDRTSVEAYRSLRSRLPQATLAPVHNEMLGAAQHRDKYPIAGSGAARGAAPGAGAGLAQIHRASRRSRFRMRGSPTRRIFRSTCISSCSAGCERFIWSSGNSTCAFCSPICNPRSGYQS